MGGELTKLRIEAYADIAYATKKTDEFVVMFNPTGYEQKYEIEYEESQGQGTTGTPQKFKKIKPQEYTFEFLLDGTGTAAPPVEEADADDKRGVMPHIENFLAVTGKLDGETHRPSFLLIHWGQLTSRCVLKSAAFAYSLFLPNGYPLRAKITATFSEAIEDLLRVQEENKSSPDLTHLRWVQDRDTLPLMSFRIYGDSTWYARIARHNDLDQFRRPSTGARISFPPSETLFETETEGDDGEQP
jgi:hypothetical protein